MNDPIDWILIFPWRLRVCLYGWRIHGWWVWSHISLSDWYETRSLVKDPHEAYIEGWCRE